MRRTGGEPAVTCRSEALRSATCSSKVSIEMSGIRPTYRRWLEAALDRSCWNPSIEGDTTSQRRSDDKAEAAGSRSSPPKAQMKMGKRCALLLLVGFAVLAAPALAGDHFRQQKVALDAKLAAAKAKIAQARAHESQLNGQIGDLNTQISSLETRVADVG